MYSGEVTGGKLSQKTKYVVVCFLSGGGVIDLEISENIQIRTVMEVRSLHFDGFLFTFLRNSSRTQRFAHIFDNNGKYYNTFELPSDYILSGSQLPMDLLSNNTLWTVISSIRDNKSTKPATIVPLEGTSNPPTLRQIVSGQIYDHVKIEGNSTRGQNAPFHKWLSQFTQLAASFTLLATADIEMLSILSSRIIGLPMFDAPVSDFVHFWVLIGTCISFFIEDAPQFVTQNNVHNNGNGNNSDNNGNNKGNCNNWFCSIMELMPIYYIILSSQATGDNGNHNGNGNAMQKSPNEPLCV
ncbi:7273_t:CDS:2 [Ambispora gerdemannii]|uniref:7273_t:CDS:1 n=1 Tax=Ambispora gerdemannii TaxID=144530 RepID=A0A9N8ZAR7_9GLOM|nr:7273_t:CDS:2 [Ambispora gerdemannii]